MQVDLTPYKHAKSLIFRAVNPYKQEVAGSSPALPTTYFTPWWIRSLRIDPLQLDALSRDTMLVENFR